MDISKYLKMYVSESEEHLQKMDLLLLKIEEEPADFSVTEALFREAHSLKGMSASMGFEAMTAVSHRMEDRLVQFRDHRMPIDRETIDLLLEGVDLLRRGVQEITQSGACSLDVAAYLSKIGGTPPSPPPLGGSEPLSAPLVPSPPPHREKLPWDPALLRREEERAREQGRGLFSLSLPLAPGTPLPAARAYMTVTRVEQLGEVVGAVPSREEIKSGVAPDTLHILLVARVSGDEVQQIVATLPDVLHGRVMSLLPSPSALSPSPLSSPPPPAPVRPSPAVRVEAQALDDLMDCVGELVTARSALFVESGGGVSRPLAECIDRVGSLVTVLHEQALQLRMMPLAAVTDRFPRVVRDLAQRMGKRVHFEVIGKEIEVDRAILEQCPDPLLHLFRNALDHGIETPEERERRGKSSTGLLRLEAEKERESILLRVIDDGRGMDPEAILRSALRKGLLTEEKSRTLSPEEILRLTTLPGFSTSEVVTDVSGRGVGLDVVRTTVESLHGSLLLDSQVGVGTVVTVKLPLTLAIIRVLLLRVGEERYALPLSAVYQTVEMRSEEIHRSQGREILSHDGRLVPLIFLHSVLGVPSAGCGPSPTRFVVIVEVKGREMGVVVDALLGYSEAVVKPLGADLDRVRGFAGVTILPDGQLVLILDLNALVE